MKGDAQVVVKDGSAFAGRAFVGGRRTSLKYIMTIYYNNSNSIVKINKLTCWTLNPKSLALETSGYVDR